jgi:hypothetical protein
MLLQFFEITVIKLTGLVQDLVWDINLPEVVKKGADSKTF